jgi:hypothetical protein
MASVMEGNVLVDQRVTRPLETASERCVYLSRSGAIFRCSQVLFHQESRQALRHVVVGAGAWLVNGSGRDKILVLYASFGLVSAR